LLLESSPAQTAQLKTRNNNFGRRYGVHGRTVTRLIQEGCASGCGFTEPMKQSRPKKLESFILSTKNRDQLTQVKQKPPCSKA
jgi:hypothetical protein